MRKILASILLFGFIFVTGCSSSSEKTLGVPSGNDCAENVAYLQQGVDKYKEEVGTYPGDVKELLNTVDGKGPFVEVVPDCPSGNQYVINNGIVSEAPKQ